MKQHTQTTTDTIALKLPCSVEDLKRSLKGLDGSSSQEALWYKKLEKILPVLTKAFQVTAKQIVIPVSFKGLPLKGGIVDYIDIYPTSEVSVRLCEAMAGSVSHRGNGFSLVSKADSEAQFVMEPVIEPGAFRLRGLLSGSEEVLREFGELAQRGLTSNSKRIGIDPLAATVDSVATGDGLFSHGVDDERFTRPLELRDTDPRAALEAFDVRTLLRYEDNRLREGATALLAQIAVKGKLQAPVMNKITDFRGVDTGDRANRSTTQSVVSMQDPGDYVAMLAVIQAGYHQEVEIDNRDLGVAGAEVLMNISAKATSRIKAKLLPTICEMIEGEFKKEGSGKTILGKNRDQWFKRLASWADGIPSGAEMLLDIAERSRSLVSQYYRSYIVSNMSTCTPALAQRILSDIDQASNSFGPLGSGPTKKKGIEVESAPEEYNIIEHCLNQHLTDNSVAMIRSIVERDCFTEGSLSSEKAKMLGAKYLFALASTPAEIADAREKLLGIYDYKVEDRDDALLCFARAFPEKVDADFLFEHLSYGGIGKLMKFGDRAMAARAYAVAMEGLEEARGILMGLGPMPWEDKKEANRKSLEQVYGNVNEFCEILNGVVDSDQLSEKEKAVLLIAVTKVLKFESNMSELDYDYTNSSVAPPWARTLRLVKNVLADSFEKLKVEFPIEFNFLEPEGYGERHEDGLRSLEQLANESEEGIHEAAIASNSRWDRISFLSDSSIEIDSIEDIRVPNGMEAMPADMLARSVALRNELETLYTTTGISVHIAWYPKNKKDDSREQDVAAVDAYGELALRMVKSLGVELSDPIPDSRRPGLCYIKEGPEGSALGSFISETRRTLGMPITLYMAATETTNQVEYARDSGPLERSVALGRILVDQRVFAGSIAEIGHKFIPEIATAVLEQRRRVGKNHAFSGYVDRRDKQHSINDGTRWIGAFLDDVVRDAVVLGVSRNRAQSITYCEEAIRRVESFAAHIEETNTRAHELAVNRVNSSGSIDMFMLTPGSLKQQGGRIIPNVRFPIATEGSKSYWSAVNKRSLLEVGKVAVDQEQLENDIQDTVRSKLALLRQAASTFRAIKEKLEAGEDLFRTAALALSIPGTLEVVRENSALFESLEVLSGTDETNSDLVANSPDSKL